MRILDLRLERDPVMGRFRPLLIVDRYPEANDFVYEVFKIVPLKGLQVPLPPETFHEKEKYLFYGIVEGTPIRDAMIFDPLSPVGNDKFVLRLRDGRAVTIVGPASSRSSVINLYLPLEYHVLECDLTREDADPDISRLRSLITISGLLELLEEFGIDARVRCSLELTPVGTVELEYFIEPSNENFLHT